MNFCPRQQERSMRSVLSVLYPLPPLKKTHTREVRFTRKTQHDDGMTVVWWLISDCTRVSPLHQSLSTLLTHSKRAQPCWEKGAVYSEHCERANLKKCRDFVGQFSGFFFHLFFLNKNVSALNLKFLQIQSNLKHVFSFPPWSHIFKLNI